jgi:hypothetical protein
MEPANDNALVLGRERICAFCKQFRHAGLVLSGNTVGWCAALQADVWAHGSCALFDRNGGPAHAA